MKQEGSANIVLITVIVAIIAIGGYMVFSKKSPSAPTTTQPQSINSQLNQQTPPPNISTGTTKPSNSVPVSYDKKIAVCYPKNEGCSACQPILNNSVQRVVETSRRFVNIPKDFFPKEISSYLTTVSGNATAGWISNGGLPGEGLAATPECWSTYYEFYGNGEVDLRVKSTQKGIPDYFVRFIVGPTQ